MAENNPQSPGADSENFYNEYYDNSSQQLKRHVYINNRGEYDHDIADFIFKKAGYTCTYIVVHTTGIPDGVILNLCDENSNQLYSPVDTNKNWITTACSITIGEKDIIPLPAQFNNELSNHVPFPVGTYNWKLVFAGNDYYEGKELPLTVEIRDFQVWDIQTPIIYPNEEIKVKVQTNANTLYPPTFDMSPLLTNNATYDYETGIITYPVSDINTNIGKHTQVINQNSNCLIDYEVMNPIEFFVGKTSFNYSANNSFLIGGRIFQDCTMNMYNDEVSSNTVSITINNSQYTMIGYGNTYNQGQCIGGMFSGKIFVPNTYNCTVTLQLDDGLYYTCEGSFDITVENCNLSLDFVKNEDTFTLTASYRHNISTPISGALIGLIDLENNALINTAITDEYGQAQWNVSSGIYKTVAINVDNEYILDSNILDFKNIYSIVTDVSLDNENDELIIEDITTLDIANHMVNTSIIMNEEGNLLMTSLSLMDINRNTNIITNVYTDEEHEDTSILIDSLLFSEIDNNTNIVDYILIDDNKMYINTAPLNFTNMEVVMDVDLDDSQDISITKEQYININNIDNVISDVSYNDDSDELIIKTIGDMKEEVRNQLNA